MRYVFIILAILAVPILGQAATLKVPSQYQTIQNAIDAASGGDTVLVSPGTYVENIDFKGKAISVTSKMGVDATVIDGNRTGSVVKCQSGEGPSSALNGFTITNGSGTKFNLYGAYSDVGGGIFNYSSSPTVTNCIITKNVAPYADIGSGMANINNSNPTIFCCSFDSNWASSRCGGMLNVGSNPKVSNCTFSNNIAGYYYQGSGGGMFNDNSNPTVTNCIFSNNLAGRTSYNSGGGGGMCNDSSNPTVNNCIFTGNSATFGGGMNNDWCSPTVTNCHFIGNESESGGGGMSNELGNPTIANCVFIDNMCSGSHGGGGMCNMQPDLAISNCTFIKNKASNGGGMVNWSGSLTVTNCTFIKNNASSGGGMYNDKCDPKVINSIFWDDIPEEIIGYTVVNFSCVQGSWPGMGNIDSDPLFVDSANDDFHLTFSSPCKGTAANYAVTELYDFEGDPRIAYGTVDMGADEFFTHLYWTGDAAPGGNVEIKFVGLPGTSPVGLCIGSGVLDPPLKSMWGDWYLKFPIIGPIGMPQIPSTGVLVIPGIIPASPPAPYSLPMQALIGVELSNLCVMEVK